MNATLTSFDGLKLHLQEWPCAGARGTVLILHGLGEHIGRYAHVAAHLNACGWAVAGPDHRGHGRSEGARGRVATDDALLRDVGQFIAHVRADHPGPLVLLGHSMGGLLAARFCAEGLSTEPAAWHRAVDALVLSSPALDLGMNVAQQLLLAVLGPLAPDLAVGNGLDPAWVSRDPAVVKAYVDDPLVHDRVSPRLVRFMVNGGERVQRVARRWAVPTLLMYSGSDRCVAPRGSAALAQAAPASALTAQEFKPLFHEIFNEPERGEVFAALQAWLADLHKVG